MSKEQAEVLTGMIFPSAGVRVLIPLVVSAFLEKALGEPMSAYSDYNMGVSVGAVPATAFALDEEGNPGTPRFTAKEVLDTTFATCLVMFSKDPGKVLLHNIHRDVTRSLANRFTGRVGAQIIRTIQKWDPSAHLAKYDHGILERSLGSRYGDTKMGELTKSVLLFAHGLRTEKPNLFAYIDEKVFPPFDNIPLTMHGLPVHRNNRIVQALLATTAIPGFIGYRCVDSLGEVFMDSGAFSAPGILDVVEDLQDLAQERVRREFQGARGAWVRTALNYKPSSVVSRMLVMGVGNQKGASIDENNEHGVAANAAEIMRAGGCHVEGFLHARVGKRLERPSQDTTGRPALQMIDLSMIPQNDEERVNFPSTDIRDGRLDNLLKLIDFGKRVIHANRDILFDEAMLRMRTLEKRGKRTAEQVAAVEARIAALKKPGAIDALCERIIIKQDDVPDLLQHHCVENIAHYVPGYRDPNMPVPVGKFETWVTQPLQRAAGSLASFTF